MKSRTAPAAGTSPSDNAREPPRTSVVRRWLAVALAAVLSALAVGGAAMAWDWYRLPARVAASLPPLPDLSGKPAELQEHMQRARTLALDRGSALEGVEALGRLCQANGFPAQAEACWRLLQVEQPHDGRWSYYLADLRRTAGDESAVAALLAETVQRAPDYAPAWLRLADLEFKSGRADAAEAHYRRRLELVPRDPYARLGLARLALQRGNRGEARQGIEQIIHDTPDFSTAHNVYAEMLAADGKADEALQERNRGRETGRFREADDPWLEELHDSCYDPKRLALLSALAYQTGAGDRGVAFLQRAVHLAPDDAEFREKLGTLYLQLGRPADAQTTFEQALQLPRSTDYPAMLAVNLAESLRLQKNSEQALRVVQDALTRAPDAYELHGELGAVFADLGHIEESVQAYRDAVALAPNDADSNFNLGSGLLALGKREEAIGFLKRSLTLQPTYPQTLMLLGRLAFDAGDLEEAKRYWQPLYDSHPEQAQARRLLALYHLRAGEAASERKDAAAAERHFRDGLAIDPDVPEINVDLGVLCLVQGRPAEALAPFEAYHRLRPQDPQSSLFLGQLYAQLGRFAEARKILAEGADLAERAGNTETAGHCREILAHLPPGGP